MANPRALSPRPEVLNRATHCHPTCSYSVWKAYRRCYGNHWSKTSPGNQLLPQWCKHSVPHFCRQQLFIFSGHPIRVHQPFEHSIYVWATLGQAINRQKIALFFILNIVPIVREEIHWMFDAQLVTEFEKYLNSRWWEARTKWVPSKNFEKGLLSESSSGRKSSSRKQEGRSWSKP